MNLNSRSRRNQVILSCIHHEFVISTKQADARKTPWVALPSSTCKQANESPLRREAPLSCTSSTCAVIRADIKNDTPVEASALQGTAMPRTMQGKLERNFRRTSAIGNTPRKPSCHSSTIDSCLLDLTMATVKVRDHCSSQGKSLSHCKAPRK